MSRNQKAHYSINVERASAYRWLWTVTHWPEAYNGYNGLVFPGCDWSKGGNALTREAANRAADRAIADRIEELKYSEEYEHREVLG